SRPVSAQAIVILGGAAVRIAPEYGGPAAELDTLERLNYGAFLAHRTSLPVLVSGSPEEANAMRITLSRDFGVGARWVEGHSADTYQNARFSAPLLLADGIHRIVLVTSSSHEWRAAHEFMGAGLEVVPAPVGGGVPRAHGAAAFVPSPVGLLRSYGALYELIGEPVRELFVLLHLRRQQPQESYPTAARHASNHG
ncbi:MAG: YdcF family protein, partial [Steroidobacteraceae bacterium]